MALVPGNTGKALQFDGESGLAIKGLPAKERWDAFTWSFWISDPRQRGPVILLHRTGGTDVGFCGFDLMLEDGYLTARVMRHWPGNAIAVRTADRVPKDQWSNIGWSWDGSGQVMGLKLYIDGKPAGVTVLADHLWKKINAYGDLGPSGGDWAFAQRFRDAGFKGGKLDDVTFANRALSDLEVSQLFDGASLKDAKDSPGLRRYFEAAIDPGMKAMRETVRKAQMALASFEEGIQEVSVMRESAKPIPAYVLARGQYDAPRTDSTLVARGVPKSLPSLQPSPVNDRLALAKWVTRPTTPSPPGWRSIGFGKCSLEPGSSKRARTSASRARLRPIPNSWTISHAAS